MPRSINLTMKHISHYGNHLSSNYPAGSKYVKLRLWKPKYIKKVGWSTLRKNSLEKTEKVFCSDFRYLHGWLKTLPVNFAPGLLLVLSATQARSRRCTCGGSGWGCHADHLARLIHDNVRVVENRGGALLAVDRRRGCGCSGQRWMAGGRDGWTCRCWRENQLLVKQLQRSSLNKRKLETGVLYTFSCSFFCKSS